MVLHLALAVAALAAAAEPAAPAPASAGAIGRCAAELARQVAAAPDAAEIALAVFAPGADGLRQPVETALAGALADRGRTVAPLRRAQLADPEAAARALGADALLRVHVTLSAGALALAGELVPVRPNFFLQRNPAARPGGSRLLTAATPADDAVRALAAASALSRATIALSELAVLPGRPLGLAAGAGAGETPRIAAVTTAGLALLDPRGAVLDVRALPPQAGPRVRDPVAVVAFGAGGPGRVTWAIAGRPEGEVLSTDGDRLAPVSTLAAAGAWAPLASGEGGAVYGAFAGGRIADLLRPSPDAEARPRSGAERLAVGAAPRAGRVAFGVLGGDFVLRLLDASLAPIGPDLPQVGAGFALADLDGDGEPEVVASSCAPGAADEVRVVRPGPPEQLVYESRAVEGAVLAGAAWDLTGDGLDDAVLAAALPDGTTRLWLLTADPARGTR